MTFRSYNSKVKKVKRFTKDDENVACKLQKLHLTKNASRVLAYLRRIKLAQTKDFERCGIFKKGLGLEMGYLFNWDKFPNKDFRRFIDYIEWKYDIGWAKDARIEKSDDGKAINIFSDRNLLLTLIYEKTVELKIDDNRAENTKNGKIDTFIVKKENGNLNIYEKVNLRKRNRKIQPQISIALKELKVRGWINEQEIKSDNPEILPYKKYSLKIPFHDIIDQLEKEAMDRIQNLHCTEDEKIISSLNYFGIRRNHAKILINLKNVSKATLYELEKNTGLYKSQIRFAVKELNLRHPDWIKEDTEKRSIKGRPFKIYSLKIGFDKIVAPFEDEEKKNISGLPKLKMKIRKHRISTNEGLSLGETS